MQQMILNEEAIAELNALLQTAVDQNDVPGVVAVVANRDCVLYRGAAGSSPNNIFRIASMTKPVTSVSIMMLRERGLLNLDDPLERYLPEFANRPVISRLSSTSATLVTRPSMGSITICAMFTWGIYKDPRRLALRRQSKLQDVEG